MPQQDIGPTWNEIFKEIGIQLRLRKSLLAKRVLWITAPAIAFFLIAKFAVQRKELQNLSFDTQIEVIYLGTFIIIILAIATIIMTAISKVEQVVWLDSYFDGKNLTSQESLKIAKKLYGPWCKLQSKLFWRYYVWIVAVIGMLFLLLCLFVLDFIPSIPVNMIITVWLALAIGTGILTVFWVRYLKIKLSYAPFIFLDTYSGQTSPQFWNDFFLELDTLNEISKGKVFEKNVLMELGADAAVTLLQWISTQMTSGLGPTVGVFLLAGKEVGIRTIYFAKLTGRYVLYRFAYKTAHSTTHHVNEYIYNLSKEA